MVSHATRRANPQIVISAPGRIAVPNLRHLWEAREVLLRFGARDITLRYRQTALGVIWVILQPLLSAGIFSVVFGQVAKLPSNGVPYFLFSFSGMLLWNLLSGVITRATPSIVGNASLVSKVFFPRILVPLSVVYSLLVDFCVAFTLLVVLLFAYGINPGWPILALPIWVLAAIMIGAGVGFVLSGLMVRYRDIQYIVPFAMQLGLYASPIAYSISAIPSKYRTLYDLNPATWLLEEFRWSTLGQGAPPVLHIVLTFVLAVVVFLGGALAFEQMERNLADIV